jgi:hypothetical protein
MFLQTIDVDPNSHALENDYERLVNTLTSMWSRTSFLLNARTFSGYKLFAVFTSFSTAPT